MLALLRQESPEQRYLAGALPLHDFMDRSYCIRARSHRHDAVAGFLNHEILHKLCCTHV